MFTPSGDKQIDALNAIAVKLGKGGRDGFGVLSTGERLYVALASNRADLLAELGYTISEALARIGAPWIKELIVCWRYAWDPAKGG